MNTLYKWGYYKMNAIEVHQVKKKFKVYYDKGQSFKERFLFKNRNHYEERWVLQGISFKVKKGEAIGLIGQNGCGKSTLLKLLTKIMYPDNGNIIMNGRISSLIELGAGFHPDMSGRENIYTNASIFGLDRKEIDRRLRTIIDFSELGDFIDNPVRTYSSGMYMRLAFSVAINVDADILLIDEILAVGDANFQAKCFNKLQEIKKNGTTIVIVSHTLGQIEQICERSLWIQNGVIRMEGKPREVHPHYIDYVMNQNGVEGSQKKQEESIGSEDAEIIEPIEKDAEEQQCTTAENTIERWGSGDAKIVKIRSYNAQGKETKRFCTGEEVKFCIDYNAKKKIEKATFGLGIIRNDDVYCYGSNTLIDGIPFPQIDGEGTMEVCFKQLNLLPGVYNLDIAIEDYPPVALDYYKKAYQIEVYSSINDVGTIRMEHSWNLRERT